MRNRVALVALVALFTSSAQAYAAGEGVTLTAAETKPRVMATSNPASGEKELLIEGHASLVPSTIYVVCQGQRRSVNVTQLNGFSTFVSASYSVPAEAVDAVVSYDDCLLLVGQVRLALPRERLASVWAPPATRSASVQGEVIGVLDGETIRVRLGQRTEDIAYLGISAPVWKSAKAWHDATDMNRYLVLGKTVRLSSMQARDHHGRLPALVYVDTTLMNAEMVRRGYAVTAGSGLDGERRKLFLELQARAKAQGAGSWADARLDAVPVAAQVEAAPSPSGGSLSLSLPSVRERAIMDALDRLDQIRR